MSISMNFTQQVPTRIPIQKCPPKFIKSLIHIDDNLQPQLQSRDSQCDPTLVHFQRTSVNGASLLGIRALKFHGYGYETNYWTCYDRSGSQVNFNQRKLHSTSSYSLGFTYRNVLQSPLILKLTQMVTSSSSCNQATAARTDVTDAALQSRAVSPGNHMLGFIHVTMFSRSSQVRRRMLIETLQRKAKLVTSHVRRTLECSVTPENCKEECFGIVAVVIKRPP